MTRPVSQHRPPKEVDREKRKRLDEERMEWPSWYFLQEQHPGSSLSDPETPFHVSRMTYGGAE